MNKQSVSIFAKAFFPLFTFAFVFFCIFPFAVSWLGEAFDSAYLIDWGQRDIDKDSFISKSLFMGVVFGLYGVHNEYRAHQESRDSIKRVAKLFVPLFFGTFIALVILPFVALKHIAFLEDFARAWLDFGLSFPIIIATAVAFGLLALGYFRKNLDSRI